jgi:single-strand DNA-binding protein
MSDLNVVCLVGRIIKNAASGVSGNDTPFWAFSIAVHRSRQIDGEWEETAHYVDFRLFGEKWRSIGERLQKGSLVSIQGHLEQDRWEQDGKKRSALKVAADRVRLLAKAEYAELGGQDEQDLSPFPSLETAQARQEGE